MLDKDIASVGLTEKGGFSADMITRLKRDHYIALNSIEKICHVLDCGVDDILDSYRRIEAST
jgi:DNA-binding Xre family transcriptional regulator